MSRFESSLLCALVIILVAGAVYAGEPTPQIGAESAILIDAVTGKVLFEKQCRVRRPPASTTKIMTAILLLEKGDLTAPVCASEKASSTPFSSLHLKPGEQMTLKDLLYGLMLRSGNDAAVCAAEHIAGSEEDFVQMMNEKAQEIGAKDTNFANPHGLHHADHYSTAFDLAVMARYAIDNPDFNEVVNTRTARISRSVNHQDVYLKNTARFLWRFDGADGIKTGYTKEAGRCFVGSATRDGWRLISVVLKATDAGADTAVLLDYGFKSYKQVAFARQDKVMTNVPVRGGVAETIDLLASDDLASIYPRSARIETNIEMDPKRVSAPFRKGQKLGTLTGYVNGEEIGSVDLLAAESVDRTLLATILYIVRTVLIVLLISVTGFLLYGTAVAKAARRRRRSLASRS